MGEPEAVADAALAAAKTASLLIDMSKHSGAHPRMGALDVCPFVPVSGMSMDDCVELSTSFGKRLSEELGVPVYLYEAAATRPERRSLADIRSGEYEGLAAKLAKPEWKPDFGKAVFVPRWGATVTGAREFLIAYNVNVNTRDKKLANEIALTIREAAGRPRTPPKHPQGRRGQDRQSPGTPQGSAAIGWYIDSYRTAQVSINLLNYRVTPPPQGLRDRQGRGGEARPLRHRQRGRGPHPPRAPSRGGRHFLKKAGKSEGECDRELIEVAVHSMGLDSVGPFDPEKKVVEYAAARALVGSATKLVGMRVADFVDEVASESPAPGGGSVAALAGSLGAALASMAANLTVGKKGYEAVWAEMSDFAVKAQGIKAELLAAVDADTAAFGELMEALHLPKASPAEKAVRDAAIEEGYKKASLVPLESAAICLEAIKLSRAVAARGQRELHLRRGGGRPYGQGGSRGGRPQCPHQPRRGEGRLLCHGAQGKGRRHSLGGRGGERGRPRLGPPLDRGLARKDHRI